MRPFTGRAQRPVRVRLGGLWARAFPFCLATGWGACSPPPPPPAVTPEEAARTVAEGVNSMSPLGRFLEAATAGDAWSENLVGFMLFYGESAPLDPGAALYWFERAAANGSPEAQANMALLHELGTTTPRDRQAALRYFRRARDNPERSPELEMPSLLGLVATACAPPPEEDTGAEVFGTFCAGCHGRLGVASHPDAPNFAFGERMEKPDAELLQTVYGGHDQMPEWSEKIPDEMISAALRHARRLQEEFRHGTVHRTRPVQDLVFQFGLMESNPYAYEVGPADAPFGPSFDQACRRR